MQLMYSYQQIVCSSNKAQVQTSAELPGKAKATSLEDER